MSDNNALDSVSSSHFPIQKHTAGIVEENLNTLKCFLTDVVLWRSGLWPWCCCRTMPELRSSLQKLKITFVGLVISQKSYEYRNLHNLCAELSSKDTKWVLMGRKMKMKIIHKQHWIWFATKSVQRRRKLRQNISALIESVLHKW